MSPGAAPRRTLALIALVLAGELIFSLPFHLPRYFRVSVLAGLDLSNTALGAVFAVYGVTALLAYFPGGALADRLPPRTLMALSLLATAASGLYLATLPGPGGLAWLYGYWGVTTILLFWAAMLRATRAWGGEHAQGLAFGLLDGGRGLVAALGATVAVALFLFATGTEADAELAAGARRDGLRTVCLLYSAATALAALPVWWWLPAARDGHAAPRDLRASLHAMLAVSRLPAVWLQAAVVVCAYCGYKGLDNYALYAHEVLGWSETRAAALSAGAAWLRAPAAIVAGLVADRCGVARSVTVLFTLATAAALVLAGAGSSGAFVFANLALSFVAVFALRGIYFALVGEAGIPLAATGTAIGLVSLVGFTPDVFFGLFAGFLLDTTPGAGGHRHYFLLLAAIAAAGALTAALLARRTGSVGVLWSPPPDVAEEKRHG